MVDQNKTGGEKPRLCKDCGEKPTMSAKCPYCASCMRKKSMAARERKKLESGGGDPKPGLTKTPPGPKEAPKSEITATRVDFGGHAEVLRRIEKLAEEEMRPLDLQIIYILKSYLKRDEAPA